MRACSPTRQPQPGHSHPILSPPFSQLHGHPLEPTSYFGFHPIPALYRASSRDQACKRNYIHTLVPIIDVSHLRAPLGLCLSTSCILGIASLPIVIKVPYSPTAIRLFVAVVTQPCPRPTGSQRQRHDAAGQPLEHPLSSGPRRTVRPLLYIHFPRRISLFPTTVGCFYAFAPCCQLTEHNLVVSSTPISSIPYFGTTLISRNTGVLPVGPRAPSLVARREPLC